MSVTFVRGSSPFGQGVRDIAVKDGVFVDPREIEGLPNVTVVEADGLVALPGFVDLHTHLRQPGMEHAETVASGSRAAALGGYTAVFAMANTSPVADTPERTDQVFRWGVEANFVDVRPVGAVTKGLGGVELAALAEMAAGAGGVTIFSDDGKCVFDPALMKRALELSAELGVVIAQHAQDPGATVGAVMNAGALAERLGLIGWPASAEETVIARDIELAQQTGGKLHVCHVSTAGSVEILKWAKARGVQVTAEVTPHHLMLTEDLVASTNPLFKVNPPLRTAEDTVAVRRALAEGVIDVVATDHAPHPAETKECAFSEASFGMMGLESALGVVRETLVETGLMNWSDVARVMSTRPAEIGQLPGYAQPLSIGAPAHLTLVAPDLPTPPPHGSLSSNNPYREMSLRGAIRHTFFHGRPTVTDGHLVEGHRGKGAER